jgi:NAD(P)H-hydrate epimerase
MTGSFLSRAELRELDRRAIEEYGVPGVVLMENAGRGAAEVLLRLGVHGPVLICCGRGNNGGDGFVMARHLDNVGVAVRVLLFCPPHELTGDAAINHRILEKAAVPMHVFSDKVQHAGLYAAALQQELARVEWVVDALFGTGLSGPVRPPLDQVIVAINDGPARVLAVDIPSGLDCDLGAPLGPTVRAEHTVTFVAQKKGFANAVARAWLGQVHVVDIGAPRALLPGRPPPVLAEGAYL